MEDSDSEREEGEAIATEVVSAKVDDDRCSV